MACLVVLLAGRGSIAQADDRADCRDGLVDSDGDGLADVVEDENHNGRRDHGETDPYNPDTDGGGMDDGKERRIGTGPAHNALIDFPEPMVFDMVRGLGSEQGEIEINTLVLGVVVSPLQTSVGDDIDLSSQAVDQEGDPMHSWTSNSGMITDTAAAATTYTCTEATDDEVTVTVTDDGGEHCVSAWTVPVTSIASRGGSGGAGGVGGAQPVDYDEAVDGDLGFIEGVGYTVTVTVAPGINTVSGVIGFDGTNADIDPFFLIVPDGQQIESIEFDYTTTILANPGYAGYTTYLDTVSGGATISNERVEATEVPSESREFYADVVPLGPGQYALGRPGGSRRSDMIFEVAYTWTIVVSWPVCPSSL